MKRRGFLAMLAGAALDPERALWTPGRRLISIPKEDGVWYPGVLVRDIRGPFDPLTGTMWFQQEWIFNMERGPRIGSTITVPKPLRFR